jgi:modulator of FtsH protease
MTEHLTKQVEAWHDFYVMVGGGSAALTGLLFVIVSLGPHVVAGREKEGVRAFISPVAAHFTFVLVISALMLAPEVPLPILGGALVAGGLGGTAFTVWSGAHRRWRASGQLPFLDWIWFVSLPHACFAMMIVSGAALAMGQDEGLYGIAFTLILLVVTGIRNAWDLVLWVAQQPRPETPAVVASGKAKTRRK